MKRLRRIIFNSVTVLSLVLCVVTVGLWVRSYSVADEISWRAHAADFSAVRRVTVRTSHGGFQIEDYRLRFKHARYDLVNWMAEHEGVSFAHPTFCFLPQWTTESSEFRDDILGAIDGWPDIEAGSPRVETYVKRAEDGSYANSWRGLVMPYWLLMNVLALLPTGWFGLRVFRRWRSKRVAPIGACNRCGYDLRATPDRCPECGRMANGAKKVVAQGS